MLNCYKCEFKVDNGVTYKKKICIVFTDDIEKIPRIIYNKFAKHSDETIININIEKINPEEGLIISCNS